MMEVRTEGVHVEVIKQEVSVHEEVVVQKHEVTVQSTSIPTVDQTAPNARVLPPTATSPDFQESNFTDSRRHH